jgi:hypothetical protein
MMSLTALLFYDASTPSCASGITSGVKFIISCLEGFTDELSNEIFSIIRMSFICGFI